MQMWCAGRIAMNRVPPIKVRARKVTHHFPARPDGRSRQIPRKVPTIPSKQSSRGPMRSGSCPFVAVGGLGVAVGGVTANPAATAVGVAAAALSPAPG
eukprot:1444371-Pleurochrysis_carterae.AAC.2